MFTSRRHRGFDWLELILMSDNVGGLRGRPLRCTDRACGPCGPCRKVADEWGPAVSEFAEPLTKLPENPNEALVRGLAG